MSESFDYVIVGAGTAGCILANRLSADGRHTVCLLEAGGSNWHPYLHIPAGFMKTLTGTSMNWLYATEPGAGIAGRSIHAPRGKVLGGSSAINGHIINRGQRLDFDGWAQRGNRGWGFADVVPYFRRFERRIVGAGEAAADPQLRGSDGELPVTDLEWHHPLCEAFIAGAVAAGIPRNPDYNSGHQDGVGYFQRAIHGRRRISAATAFLAPARGRANLEIRTHALARALEIDEGRVTGVRYLRGGREETVTARRSVVLSGGAVNSPQLLQLSGIGPEALLRERGIPVRHALSGVGENLRDHFGPRVVARVRDQKTLNERARGLALAAEIGKYFLGAQSILTLQPSLVFCFWKSREGLDQADLQMTFTPASYKEGVQARLDDFPGMTCAPWPHRPESTGHVRIRAADPREAPEIQPNYLAHESDRQTTIGGVRLARRLLSTPALAPYYAGEELPGPGVESDDEVLDFARRRGTTMFHLMGTCRMGPASDPSAVVDDRLRLHGLDGLHIADASIMPTMPSANTNAATMMIAEKAADLILGREPPEAAPV